MYPATQSECSKGSASVGRRLCVRIAAQCVFAVGMLVHLCAPAGALAPGDLCTGDPCVIASNFTVDATVVLDFGSTTALQFAPGIKVLISNGATVEFDAGSITIGSAAKFSSDTPGSSLYFSANATNIEAGINGGPVKFVLPDSIEVGFFCEVNCAVHAKANVSGKTAEGGTFYIQSFGQTLFTGTVVADGSKDGQFNAGVVDFDAADALHVWAKLRAKGYRPDSGQVRLRGVSVDLAGKIDVKPKVGVGGMVEITAETQSILSQADIDASGKLASNDTGSNNCNGGSVTMTAGTSIQIEKKVALRGGGPGGCSGGTFTANAEDFVQEPGAPIQAATAGFVSFGGSVHIQATGNMTLGAKIDVGSDNAGSIVATAGNTLLALGQLQANSNGSGGAVDGSISLTATCNLNVPGGASLEASRPGASGGLINLVTSGGPMTIGGNVEASSAVNLQYVTGFTPVITGDVTPAPTLTEVPTGTCGI